MTVDTRPEQPGRTPGSWAPGRPASPALLTDLYELTMAAAHFAAGMADVPATFSCFVRSLPAQRGYLVAAGLDDVLSHLEGLGYDDEDLAALESTGLFDGAFLDHLSRLRFAGRVRAVPEGRVIFASEPLLEVDATLVQGQLAETALLYSLGYQTTVASKAARLREAAAGRPVADFGMRAASGADAALHLARCARIAGLQSTSNVAAAVRYDMVASGTMAHSFVQAYGDEERAFEVYARTFRERAVFLVDTYDALQGVAHAIEVARRMRDEGVEITGIRIDSGDLDAFCRTARAMLDDAGFPQVRIFATGGLDEVRIAGLLAEGVPVDSFGVGSSLAVPRDAPALDTTYKLVEVGGRPVCKHSPGKETWPGRKQVWRLPGGRGDVLSLADEESPEPGAEAVLVEVMADGHRTAAGAEDLDAAAARFDLDREWLPAGARRIVDPEPPPVRVSAGLDRVTSELGDPNAGARGGT